MIDSNFSQALHTRSSSRFLGVETDIMSPQAERISILAWYMDDSLEDPRLPHHLVPKQYVSPEKLAELGVLHWVLDADNYEHDAELDKIRQDRGYTYHDIVDVAPGRLPDYESKLKTFYEEHIHTDEEIRFMLEGCGYFDVRDFQDRWIRIWVKKGDMIILPAGIYHRFTLDKSNYAKILRLFVGEPVWTPYNRPQDDHPVRQEYLTNFNKVHQFELMAH